MSRMSKYIILITTLFASVIYSSSAFAIMRDETGVGMNSYIYAFYQLTECNLNPEYPCYNILGWQMGETFSFLRNDSWDDYLDRLDNCKKPRNGPGVLDDYTGIECSAFVSKCLKMNQHYKTSELDILTLPVPGDRVNAKRGDICVKPDVHSLYCVGDGLALVASALPQYERVVCVELDGYENINDYPCKTIFPLFSDLTPVPNASIDLSVKTVTIQLKAEGSLSIENVKNVAG